MRTSTGFEKAIFAGKIPVCAASRAIDKRDHAATRLLDLTLEGEREALIGRSGNVGEVDVNDGRLESVIGNSLEDLQHASEMVRAIEGAGRTGKAVMRRTTWASSEVASPVRGRAAHNEGDRNHSNTQYLALLRSQDRFLWRMSTVRDATKVERTFAYGVPNACAHR